MSSEQSVVPGAYRTAAIMCGVFLAAGLTIATIGPSLPVLAARVGAEVAALGGLFTAFSVGVILAQFAMPGASRRFGQRATLAASMLLMAAASLAIAQGPALLVLFASALLSGFGFGGVMATGNTLVARLFAARSASALNGINLFFGIGSIVGPALAGAANLRWGAPQVVLWAGAAVLVGLTPLVLGAPAHEESHSAGGPSGGGVPTRNWLLGLLLLVYTGSEIGFGAWLTLYMVANVQMDLALAALVVSGFWLALTSGRAIAAGLGVRMSGQRLLRLCLIGMLLGAITLVLGIGNTGLTLAGVVLFGLSCGPVFPTVLALVAAGVNGSTATSRVLALANGGGIFIPALLGLLLARSGPLAVAGLLVGTAALMIGLGAAALRPQPQPLAPAEGDCAVV